MIARLEELPEVGMTEDEKMQLEAFAERVAMLELRVSDLASALGRRS